MEQRVQCKSAFLENTNVPHVLCSFWRKERKKNKTNILQEHQRLLILRCHKSNKGCQGMFSCHNFEVSKSKVKFLLDFVSLPVPLHF